MTSSSHFHLIIIFLLQPIALLGDYSGYWHRNGDPRYALPPDYVPPPTSSTPPPPPSSARNDFLLPPAPPGSNPGNDFAPGDDDDNEPVFDNSLVTNVTAQLGGNAHLQCKVLNIRNNNPVSWIRRRDWHILSTSTQVFTQDARFAILHQPDSREWTLSIRVLKEADQGTYVCQVSTITGVKSHYFNLHVLVPTAFILGSDEYHTQAGNAISLVCIIENSLEPPQYVFWYHNGKLINYERSTRISIKTDPGPKTHSRLVINNVIKDDSGNYTCSAPNTLQSSIDVFVSPGDKTLSLSDVGSSATSTTTTTLASKSYFILLLLHLCSGFAQLL